MKITIFLHNRLWASFSPKVQQVDVCVLDHINVRYKQLLYKYQNIYLF